MGQYRLLYGIRYDCCLDGFVHPVLRIGLAPVAVQKSLDTALLVCVAIAVERIARNAHDAAGARYVAKFGSKIEQADLVFYDFLGETMHGVFRRVRETVASSKTCASRW